MLALLGWLALVLWLTWPLVDSATTHMVAGCDAYYSMWALAWQSHALATAPAQFFNANIYHPVPNALAYGPMGSGALLLFGPAFLLSGNPVLATNVLVIGGSALTAWTVGLVATRWTRSAAAGAIAGATYLGTPWVLREWVPRCPHFAILLWLPLIMERASRKSLRLCDTLALAAMIALQSAVEIVYVAPAVYVPLGLLVVVRLSRRSSRRCAFHLGGALVAAAILLSPLVAAHLAVRGANPGLAEQTTWRFAEHGPPHTAPVLPWSLFGWWRRAGSAFEAPPPMAVPPIAFGLIGCGVLSCAVRRRWGNDEQTRRAWRYAALWSVAGIVLSLPPWATILGTIVPLPHVWLREILPVAGVLRVPMRLGVIGLVGLSLLTGLAFAEVMRRVLGQRQAPPWARVVCGALALVIAVIIVEQPRTGLGYPPGFVIKSRLPLSLPVPRLTPYAAVLHADRGPLLEIGKGLFGPPLTRSMPGAIAMVRSIEHWRPLLNGYGSYWPKQYERSIWLARQLPEDLGALNALRMETGVELILVWPKHLPPEKRSAWEALARSAGKPGLALVGEGELEALLFRVTGA